VPAFDRPVRRAPRAAGRAAQNTRRVAHSVPRLPIRARRALPTQRRCPHRRRR
jgi:hypothetical protein